MVTLHSLQKYRDRFSDDLWIDTLCTMSGTLDPTLQFEVIERIGGGAFGEVFKGRNKQTDEVVAIKIIDLESAADGIEDVQQVRQSLSMSLCCVSRPLIGWWVTLLTLLFEQEIHVLSQCSCDQLTTYSGSFIAGTKLWLVYCYKMSEVKGRDTQVDSASTATAVAGLIQDHHGVSVRRFRAGHHA